jgi:fructokinase
MTAPNRSERPALGIDLGGTKIEALLLDDAGGARWRERVATPRDDYAGTLAAIAALVARARLAAGAAGCSIGIGGPGSSDPQGRIKNANSTCLNGRPLRADLEARLGQPVALANDADCLALSEATDGAGAGADVVFAVILGTGVGAGVAVGGRVLQGPNGLAGEWGHNPLPWPRDEERPGPSCYCGSHGCIETWLSGPALAADLAASCPAGVPPLDAPAIARAAEAGDPACRAALERHAERLGRSLATVINLLDPDVVVLAGGLSQLPGLAGRLPSLWTPWVFGARHGAEVRTRVALARHGDASGVRGAAWLGRAAAAG